jgi:hypothetical protein
MHPTVIQKTDIASPDNVKVRTSEEDGIQNIPVLGRIALSIEERKGTFELSGTDKKDKTTAKLTHPATTDVLSLTDNAPVMEIKAKQQDSILANGGKSDTLSPPCE